jgi:AcrR family transcriptional regulator
MEMSTRRPRGTRKRDVPLTEDGIYAATLQLIDAEGVEAVTMRRLAQALDANPMSLYHHVPNKEALLRGVAQRVSSQFCTPDAAGLPWQDRLRQLALDYRAVAHRHPKLLEHSFGRADFLQPEDPFWRGLTDTLTAAQLPAPEIPRAAAAVCAMFTGLLLSELTGALQRWATLPPAPALLDQGDGHDAPALSQDVADATFAGSLDAMIAVVECLAARARQKP